MDLLDVLVEKGDVLTAAREVQHWMYFGSEPSRALFRDAAVAAGFRFVSESSSKGELPFGIVVARTQSIEQDSIDRTVIELLNLSRRFDGDYDGWETPIVTQ
jgi:regulator of RNase E activity RraB